MADYTVWVPVQDELERLEAPVLWTLLEGLKEYGKMEGRGKSEAAAHVRGYCKQESARVRAALRKNGWPLTPPDRPWSAWWTGQKKGQQDGSDPLARSAESP